MLYALATAALAATGVAAVTMNTPSTLTQCVPVKLTWTDGTAPYYVTIFPDGQPGTTLATLASGTDATDLTWIVNLAPNQKIGFQVVDGNGNPGQTATVMIAAGSTSCMNSTSSAVSLGGTGAGGGATSTGGGAATTSDTGAGSTGGGAATASASTGGGSAAGSSPTSDGASAGAATSSGASASTGTAAPTGKSAAGALKVAAVPAALLAVAAAALF